MVGLQRLLRRGDGSREALNLLGVFGPFAQRAQALIELAERLEVEPDAEEVEEYRELLLSAWRREVDKDKG